MQHSMAAPMWADGAESGGATTSQSLWGVPCLQQYGHRAACQLPNHAPASHHKCSALQTNKHVLCGAEQPTLRISEVSSISAMKVDSPRSWQSPAPTRQKSASRTEMRACSAGTKLQGDPFRPVVSRSAQTAMQARPNQPA